jgi:transcription elongation factor Elf1
MSDINFECPFCHQVAEGPAALSGRTVKCPACGESFQVRSGSATKPQKKSCPSCGAENVMRCEMAHAQGTKTGKISGTMLGADFGGDGSISPTFGGGSVGTQSQTILAQMTAPPKAPMNRYAFWCWICFLVLGVPAMVVWFWLRVNSKQEIPTWEAIGMIPMPLVLSLVIGACIAGARGKSTGEAEHERALFSWHRQWVCLTCGHKFMPAT